MGGMMSFKKKFNDKKTMYAWTAVALVSCLLAISLLVLFQHRANENNDVMLYHDIDTLKKIFSKIHKDCYILDFKHTKNHVDFLNVIHFAGSEVGSMNLAFAKNWQGPYLKNNPKFHEKLYAVLKNKQGFFIIPADGVVLSNGKMIGKDIVLNENTDMHTMMSSKDGLLSNSGSLAAPIEVGQLPMNFLMQDSKLFQSID